MHRSAWKSPEVIRQNKNFTGGNMTKKEFKEAMLRGLGRCVIAVRQEPEKYRSLVLLACKKNFAYDPQSEGTRSWYAYTMANAYPDKETFINTTAEALRKYRPNGSWDLLHLSEILMFFAMDGYESARDALEEKYQEILAGMLARKRRPNSVFHELSDLEQLGLVLAADRKSFLRIAGDFGRLYREKKYLYDGDFAWFFSSKGGQFRKTMESAARKDENIACFMRREQADIDAQEKLRQQRKKRPERNLTGFRLSCWLAKEADPETVDRYAWAYRDQREPKARANALEAFTHCPYPGDPSPILEDTRSVEEKLRRTAWQALENLRHPAVRDFAHNNAGRGDRTSENFALLVTNYIPEDAMLLESVLRELISQKNWDEVHAAGMAVYRAFYADSVIPHPKHLLPILYEYNPCSFCRESAMEYMSRHRMVTREIWEECLYDSNDDIRRIAEKRLK